MSGTFDQRIATIESKARLLAERYHVVVSQRNAALEKIAELSKDLEASRRQIEQLQARVEYLQLASAVVPSREDLDRSRKFLSELVWEIDKCINQLND